MRTTEMEGMPESPICVVLLSIISPHTCFGLASGVNKKKSPEKKEDDSKIALDALGQSRDASQL